MKKHIFVILFVITALFNVVLVIRYQSVKNNTSSETSLIKETLINKCIIEKENENIKISANLKLIDINGDTINAKDVFKKKMLVFRYSILNCSDCVNHEFETLIKDISINQYSDDICLLAYYQNTRDLVLDYRKFQENKLDVSLYIIAENDLNIPIEKQNIPYYFVINEDLTMSNFFIPIKEMKNWTEKYLNLTFKNFF